MRPVLVTGGAGYVGSHACKMLKSAGYVPVTFDNLSTGWSDAVKFGPLETGDLLNLDRILEVFQEHKPIAVMHFAALSQVEESVNSPLKYYRNNIAGTLNLVEAMSRADCRSLVFSSTCSVYGDNGGLPVDEESALNPVNPYAQSKKIVEEVISGLEGTGSLRCIRLRYFNVGGADPAGEIGEHHRPETSLIPLTLATIAEGVEPVRIFGSDYPTPDGSCVRDFFHVEDCAHAHLIALERLTGGGEGGVFNLGTGTGYSVREVVDACLRVTNRKIKLVEAPRRPGDPAYVVSGSRRAEAELGWFRRHTDLESIIRDAWNWHRNGHYLR